MLRYSVCVYLCCTISKTNEIFPTLTHQEKMQFNLSKNLKGKDGYLCPYNMKNIEVTI